jgi:hypothetical protein
MQYPVNSQQVDGWIHLERSLIAREELDAIERLFAKS